MLMTTASIVAFVGGASGVMARTVLAQVDPAAGMPNWLTTAGVGGSLALIFWIVVKELPEGRRSRERSDERFAAHLEKISKDFHDELQKERSASAAERALDRETRHAMANALQMISLTVKEKIPDA